MLSRICSEGSLKASSISAEETVMVLGRPVSRHRITEVEERAVVDAGIQAGCRRVYLIEEPVVVEDDPLVFYIYQNGSSPQVNPNILRKSCARAT